MSQEVKRHWLKKEVYLGILALAAMMALSLAAVYYKDDLMRVTNIAGYSLLGVLVIAFIAGSTVSVAAIPFPYWLVVFTLPGVLASQWGILAPVWVGVMSALGATLGHLPTFLIGYGGGRLSQRINAKVNNRFYIRAMEWAKTHGSWAVFAMSAVFNPIHLPMTLAIGALRFPPPKFFLFSLLGNIVKSLFIAFGGYFGLTTLFRFLEM
ncbi:MAG: VTT domain-containing protein [Chloroflexi bacterium]|nr:VTT domain-containing protein [Chloroflexota bacterium]